MEERLEKVELLLRCGVAVGTIAKEMKLSLRTIQRYEERIRSHNMQRKQRAKSVVTPANCRQVKRLLTSGINQSKRGVASILRDRGVKMSPTSVLRCAKAIGIRKFPLKRKIPLGQTHRKKRVEFAKEHRSRMWINCLFVDETGISTQGSPNKRNEGQWASNRREVVDLPKFKHPPRINAFAGICYSGKSKLVVYSGSLNGDRYASILDDVLSEMTGSVFKKRKWFVVQDATPLHFTPAVMAVFKEHHVSVIPKAKWPGYSADLNPIENVWSVLKDKVAARMPSSKSDLVQFASEEWDKLPQDLVKNCILSMRDRMQSVIHNKGANTKY